MSRWRSIWTALVALPWLAGCGPAVPDPNAAMLEELRALRQAVAPAPIDSRSLAQALDPLAESLRTLNREQAAAQQRQQAMADELTRWSMFLALSGRTAAGPAWPASTIGTQPAAGIPAAATNVPAPQDPALLARIAELERELQRHEQRQQDVESVVERSLDGTAAHVDRILQRLQILAERGELVPADAGAARAPAPEPVPATSTTPAPPTRSPADAAPGVPSPGNASEPAGERPGGGTELLAAVPARNLPLVVPSPELAAAAEQRENTFLRGRTQLHQIWLIAVLTVGLGAIGLLAWRLLHRPAAARDELVDQPKGDMTTDELWAAAGLLSEAVGRLRGAVPANADATVEPPTVVEAPGGAEVAAALAPSPVDAGEASSQPFGPTTDNHTTTANQVAEPVDADDVFVLDDRANLLADVDWTRVAGEPPAAARTVVAGGDSTAPTNGHVDAIGPPEWTILLESADHVLARATIDAYLRHDPRVLRQPAPQVRGQGQHIEVRLSLLPGLLAGEREHLRSTLQRLLLQA